MSAQVAGSLVLLVATGLVLRSLDRISDLDLGLNPGGVAVASVDLSVADEAPVHSRITRLMSQLEAHPAVSGAAASFIPDGSALFAGSLWAEVAVPGLDPPTDAGSTVAFNVVTPGYFELMEIPIRRGRGIGPEDVPGAPAAAVINRAFADRYLGAEDPLGGTFRVTRSGMFDSQSREPGRDYTVVGIARGISLDPTRPPAPAFWTAMAQMETVDEVVVHLKGKGDAADAVPLLREVLRAERLDPSLFHPQPYQKLVDLAFAGSEAASKMLGWAGAFTLLLAAGGVFGIVSYSVARRTREMAVRAALGARRAQVVSRVVRDSMAVVGIGILGGLGVVALGAPLARRVLFGLPPLDPPALFGGTAILVLATLLASWLPARRVAKIEPVGALTAD